MSSVVNVGRKTYIKPVIKKGSKFHLHKTFLMSHSRLLPKSCIVQHFFSTELERRMSFVSLTNIAFHLAKANSER